MAVSAFRRDVTTGAWALIAPERSRRPHDWRSEYLPRGPILPFDPSCPFCPGNEHLLPSIVSEVAASAEPGWQVRVVPNKYPAVCSDANLVAKPANADTVAGRGLHRVIIESPRHDPDFDALTDQQATAVLSVYHTQFVELAQRPGTKSVILFRNWGVLAGASSPHPHSQIISLGINAPQMTRSELWARDYYARYRRCAACDYVQSELQDRHRIVEVTRSFVALVPFAATQPFEVHIWPTRHLASFASAEASELADLAMLLRRVLQRLKKVIGDAPYNWVVDSTTPREQESPFLHWRFRLLPALVIPGGFEFGAGLPINPSSPEEDARTLRGAVKH